MRRPEQQLQIAVAAYLRVALKPPTIWTAIGHGGGGKVRGAILKAMGVQAGWPDILVISPDRIIVAIELKSKRGKQSPEQHATAIALRLCRADYFLCKSINDVELALTCCNVPLHARISS